MSKTATKDASKNAANSPKPPFYITTTLPYVNAEPHIGFAMELIRADIIARAKKLQGHEVFFNTGTDEHGLKIYQKAQQSHKQPQEYADEAAAKFKELLPVLGIAENEPGITFNFIRTTDADHIKAAQEFWKIADRNGLIYKKNYKIKYCVGCELEKTESELVDGKCPLHPLTELEVYEEENYFFRFSVYQKALMDLYEKGSSHGPRMTSNRRADEDAPKPIPFVVPSTRLNEIKAFVERGLEDFSISRLATKMPWGIPVPNDPTHVMYVWFDALVNYIAAVGWPDDQEKFQKWWVDSGGAVQYCGKDNLRQQSAMWQAMLMAVKLPPSKQIVVDGFITGEGGLKMSKSLGNGVDPLDVVREYGTDALRYYVARELHPFEDSSFSMEKFKEAYNAHLANGLGNLTSRIMKMAEANINEIKLPQIEWSIEFISAIDRYDLKAATDIIWAKIAVLDSLIQKEEPFKKVKEEATKSEALKFIERLIAGLAEIARLLEPILPLSAGIISKCLKENKVPSAPLFMRK
jgi:methionyl-tRNA synthetase